MSSVSKVSDLVGTSTLRDDGTVGLTGRRITGARCVLENCLRAVITKRKSMSWAPGEGEDLRELENGDYTATQLARKKAGLDAQIRAVDFVRSVISSLRINEAANNRLEYRANISIVDAGTFPLAVTADKAGEVLGEL